MTKAITRPSLHITKGDDHYQQQQEWGDEEDGFASDSGTDVEDCPLCLEEMDESDARFIPCPCSYQICRFCWHKIREEGNQKCPACRRTYTDEDVQFMPEPAEKAVVVRGRKAAGAGKAVAGRGAPAKKAAVATPSKTAAPVGGRGEHAIPSRKSLSEFRVIQRNLVYVIGISARIAHENVLKEPEYFGQYGRIVKIVVNRRNLTAAGGESVVGNGGMTSSSTTGPSASAYITFVRKDDAQRAIQGVDGSVFDGRVLRATYGTTKYCSFYLRGMQCTNAGCMYLHEEGENVDSFTKDELQAGKMHLHSYVLEKAEAAGMKQFGVVQRVAARPAVSPPSQPVPPVASKPVTPVPVVAQPFYDHTPSSFFERLSRLAAPRAVVDDRVEEGREPPGLPVPIPAASPPAVTLPPRRLFAFDPFMPAEELLRRPAAVGSSAATPVARPAPIGSPVSGRLHHQAQQSGGANATLSFSESIRSPTVSRPPREPPHWLNHPAPAQQSAVEPSVEQFFHLFQHGALGTRSHTEQRVPPSSDSSIRPAPASGPSAAAQVAPSAGERDRWREEEDKLASLKFNMSTSIFEDPAIVQARRANAHQRLVRPVSQPVLAPAAAPPSQSGGGSIASQAPAQFTTVGKAVAKKEERLAPAASKKAKQQTVPPGSQSVPSTKPAVPLKQGHSAPSPPAPAALLSQSQNAFMALLQESTSPSTVPADSGGRSAEALKVKSAAAKERERKKLSPSLAALDPAILASSSSAAASAAAPSPAKPPPSAPSPQHYTRAKTIPSARRPDPALLAADFSHCRDLDQLQAHIQQLEAARRASHAETLQIEAFMRELVRRSWPASKESS